MTKQAKFLRIPVGELEGLFEIAPWKGDINLEADFTCPCCLEKLRAGLDICQWGMFEDSYTTYLICRTCVKAWELSYKIPTYTLFSKAQQRKHSSVKAKHLHDELSAK